MSRLSSFGPFFPKIALNVARCRMISAEDAVRDFVNILECGHRLLKIVHRRGPIIHEGACIIFGEL